MSIQSEAALEAGLIAMLQQMDYEYVQIAEEENLQAYFKRQLKIYNRKRLAERGCTGFTDEEFDKILICLKEYDCLQKEQPEIIQQVLKEKHLGLIKPRKALTRIMNRLRN